MIKLENVSSKLVKDYKDKSLEQFDELNFGRILPLSNPATLSYSVKYRSIDYTSLSRIKEYLTPNEKGIVVWPWCRRLGNSDVPKLVTAIDMYTDQIENQSKLTQDRDGNLFTYQKQERVDLVQEKYAYIIAYLLCTAKESLLWTDLSENTKELYLSSVNGNKLSDGKIRKQVIDYISNYTTLEQLENLEKENYKVLNKFIKR